MHAPAPVMCLVDFLYKKYYSPLSVLVKYPNRDCNQAVGNMVLYIQCENPLIIDVLIDIFTLKIRI